jgi:hypothetical protein
VLRQQIGNIPPEKLETLYATATDYSEKLQQVNAATSGRGRTAMLDSDREKIGAVEKTFHADLGAFLTLAEVTDFTMRSGQLGSQLRYALSPFRATEDDFRTIFQQPDLSGPISDADSRHSPARCGPATRAAVEQMNSQIAAAFGPDRTAEFLQATNIVYSMVNRFVARLDLPLSAAVQVVAVQQDVQQRATALRSDPSLSGGTGTPSSAPSRRRRRRKSPPRLAASAVSTPIRNAAANGSTTSRRARSPPPRRRKAGRATSFHSVTLVATSVIAESGLWEFGDRGLG